MHSEQKIYQPSVRQRIERRGKRRTALLQHQIHQSDILPLWEINPHIHVKGRHNDTLQDGGGHPYKLKPNFFRSQ